MAAKRVTSRTASAALAPTPSAPVQTEAEAIEPDFVGKAAEILRPMLANPAEAPKAAAAIVASVEMFIGPLPPPQHLQRYDSVVPGAAREIMSMAVREQSHRHKMQRLEMIYPYFGWFSGTVGLLGCIGGAIYLATLGGHDALAGGLMGVPVVGVLGWFINARISSAKAQASIRHQVQKKAVKQKGRGR